MTLKRVRGSYIIIIGIRKRHMAPMLSVDLVLEERERWDDDIPRQAASKVKAAQRRRPSFGDDSESRASNREPEG